MDNAVVGSQVDRLKAAIDDFVRDRDYFEKLADEHFQKMTEYKKALEHIAYKNLDGLPYESQSSKYAKLILNGNKE